MQWTIIADELWSSAAFFTTGGKKTAGLWVLDNINAVKQQFGGRSGIIVSPKTASAVLATWRIALARPRCCTHLVTMAKASSNMIVPPAEAGVEEIVANLVLWLKLGIEAIGALVIGVGMILASVRFTRGSFPPTARDFIDARLTLARFLAIALEFQLGADILSTAVAPSWDAIGKLAAIAIIRTALNYFLSREMQDERTGAATP